MIRVAIVDDDRKDIQQLQAYLEQYRRESGEAMDITVFTDGDEIAEGYRPRFDLILMDVEMRFLDGMSAAREIRKTDPEVVIIFITNMAQYAIQGYEVDALDYVLKPVSYFAFSQRLGRAITRMKRRGARYLTIPVKGGARKLEASQIYYVESRDHELTFHTAVGDFNATLTMREAERSLSGLPFFRGNNSYLINLEHVDGVLDGCAVVRGDRLLISRGRRGPFLEALSDQVGGGVL